MAWVYACVTTGGLMGNDTTKWGFGTAVNDCTHGWKGSCWAGGLAGGDLAFRRRSGFPFPPFAVSLSMALSPFPYGVGLGNDHGGDALMDGRHTSSPAPGTMMGYGACCGSIYDDVMARIDRFSRLLSRFFLCSGGRLLFSCLKPQMQRSISSASIVLYPRYQVYAAATGAFSSAGRPFMLTTSSSVKRISNSSRSTSTRSSSV